MTTCTAEATHNGKRIVMDQTVDRAIVDEQWVTGQELPVIPEAVFYRELAKSWERRFGELCENDKILTSILMEVNDE